MSGKPEILQTNNHWEFFARDYIAEQTRKWIREGWPVVVGVTVDGPLQWHYAVATEYTETWRDESVEYELNVHTGWPKKDERTKPWKFELHYAAIARY